MVRCSDVTGPINHQAPVVRKLGESRSWCPLRRPVSFTFCRVRADQHRTEPVGLRDSQSVSRRDLGERMREHASLIEVAAVQRGKRVVTPHPTAMFDGSSATGVGGSGDSPTWTAYP